jgi:5-(carboxyamino)imidazole ribonucleotide mutase
MKNVSVVMGSKKDLAVMQKAADLLETFGVPHDVIVMSAHKTLDRVLEFADAIPSRDVGVVIAGAGKAAHLAGVIAARTTVPVIGVPMSASLEGLDALLSTVQMPTGIPVATVGIDGSTNAALLAVAILALDDDALSERLAAYRAGLADTTYEELRSASRAE